MILLLKVSVREHRCYASSPAGKTIVFTDIYIVYCNKFPLPQNWDVFVLYVLLSGFMVTIHGLMAFYNIILTDMGSESAPEIGSYGEGGMPGTAHGTQKTSPITENWGKTDSSEQISANQLDGQV